MRKAFLVLAAIGIAGCSDRAPTDSEAVYRPELSSSSHISQYFAFLSPVPPGSQSPVGAFHAYADPRLEICHETGSDCTPVTYAELVDFGTGIDPLTVDLVNEQYATNWTNLNALPRGYYRLTVTGRPLSGTGDRQPLGSVTVELVASGGSGLQVGGNTLPIKFRILVGAFCESSDCVETAVDAQTGGNLILEPVGNTAGTFGLEFGPDFLCGANQTHCGEPFVIVTLERYQGPERCIPVAYNAIQGEACVTIRVEPYGVKVTGVRAGMCVEPFFDQYITSGHARMLKVRESATGVIQPSQIVDLNAVAGLPFFFQCNDEFDPALQGSSSSASTDASSGVMGRLAGAAAAVLRPLGRLLTPPAVHARRRGAGPVIASLEDFSRIGPVLPVAAAFEPQSGTIVGLPNALLSASSQPRARVLTTRIPGSTYQTTADHGVGGVRVTFTPSGGTTQTVYTNSTGYATAAWTLGPVTSNPQSLYAEVFYPTPVLQNVDFPNFPSAWATNTFNAIAQEFFVYFLSPLGSGGGGGVNATSPQPSVRVCGPLPSGATNAPGQTCDAPLNSLTLPTPELSRKGDYWTTAWKTDKNTIDNSLYRIDVLVNGYSTGGFLVRRGGGGGSDPVGTYQFQTGSNLPIKFTMER